MASRLFVVRLPSSTFGRFLTPDWSASPEPIPYASMGNPQTLNLFAYVENNPITGTEPVGVVFRRGPSRSVLLISWNTADDTFRTGQWLRGRIYVRRCDLSPEGDPLLYFAANYREPYRSWSAISRPPFLTALSMWPKGDGWGGGGHLLSRTRVALNHSDGELNLAEGFSVPKWLKVEQFGQRPVEGICVNCGLGSGEPLLYLAGFAQ
jgi:hypothetical protein